MKSKRIIGSLLLGMFFLVGCSSAKHLAVHHKASSRPFEGGSKVGQDRKLDRRAWLFLEVDKQQQIYATIKYLKEMTNKESGYVAHLQTDHILMRIPQKRLDKVLTLAEKLGHVKRKKVRTVDVTEVYTDLGVRIKNAKVLGERLRALLVKTQNITEVLKVEKALARTREKLERLEGQMKVLDRNTKYASLEVTVTKRVRPGPVVWVFYGVFTAVKWLFVWD